MQDLCFTATTSSGDEFQTYDTLDITSTEPHLSPATVRAMLSSKTSIFINSIPADFPWVTVEVARNV